MRSEADFVDEVAQAVIDKIEERGRVTSLVELVAARVMELQKQEADYRAELSQQTQKEPGDDDGTEQQDGTDGR